MKNQRWFSDYKTARLLLSRNNRLWFVQLHEEYTGIQCECKAAGLHGGSEVREPSPFANFN